MRSAVDERESAEKLLGSVQVRRQGPGSALTEEDLMQLATPLEGDEAIYVLCTKHHLIIPINFEGRSDLSERAGIDASIDWTGKYLEVSGCPFCTKDCRFENPVIKDYRSA